MDESGETTAQGSLPGQPGIVGSPPEVQPAARVTGEEKFLLALYRINEALGDLEHRSPLTFWDWIRGRRLGRRGVGWASAHHSLCKANAAFGLVPGCVPEIANIKTQVKDIERRLYAERGVL